jgi:nicotinamidase-related amidase
MKDVSLEWYSIRNVPSLGENPITSIFIIDPQVDFHPGGSLAVAGADEDSKRIADMIKKNKHNIHEIFVSLDSHHPSHIAHAEFWVGQKGNRPAPFTSITYKDVVNEVWRPRDDSPVIVEWCKSYTKALERKGRMTLTIWPNHCIIGTRGHAIEANINEALQEWSSYSKRPVTYVLKGQNCRTEMYSALEAEVVDPLDQSTALNNELLSLLRVADRVCILYLPHIIAFLLHFINPYFSFLFVAKHYRTV